MPKGVEHARTVVGVNCPLAIYLYTMPKGVEHYWELTEDELMPPVYISMMPKGVEHKLSKYGMGVEQESNNIMIHFYFYLGQFITIRDHSCVRSGGIPPPPWPVLFVARRLLPVIQAGRSDQFCEAPCEGLVVLGLSLMWVD